MPLPREDVDATTPKFLRDKYAIVGVGETAYTRGSNMTTRALATIAVRNAMLDAGLKALTDLAKNAPKELPIPPEIRELPGKVKTSTSVLISSKCSTSSRGSQT